MTGPLYPHPRPAPGSNLVGTTFTIGVSPIGDISPFDVFDTIIAQYANSPTMTAMIESFNAALDLTELLDSFYDLVWNVQTAQGYGLDVWGRIVGLRSGRVLPTPGGGSYFGFEEAGGSWTGFGQGGFYGGGGVTSNIVLQDDDFRRLILAKAASNITDGSIPSLNALLLALFPNKGDSHVQDNLDMSMTIVLPFTPTVVDLAILAAAAVIPIPAGVAVNVSHL